MKPTASQKRSVRIGDRKTSVHIEDVFWKALTEVARRRRRTLQSVIEDIAENANGVPLSSAIRIAAFEHFYELAHMRRPPLSTRKGNRV